MADEHSTSRERAVAAPHGNDALTGAAGALVAASVYTLLATIVLLSSYRAPGWQLWLGAVPAGLLAAAAVLGGLAGLRSRREHARR